MNKRFKTKDLSINTLLFSISNFGSKILTFLLVPLYTYVLSTSDFGNLDLVNTTSQLLIPILTLNVQDAILRFSLDGKYNSDEVLNVGIRTVGFSSLFLGIALLIVGYLPFFNIQPLYLIYLYALFVTGSLNNIMSMYLKAINKVKLLVISGILHTFITCILNIVLLLVLKWGIIGYLIANIAGTVIALILMVVGSKALKCVSVKTKKHLMKEMFVYSAPLIANSLAWWINNASDRYILTFFCGAALNGIYAVSYKIPSILSTIQTIFYNAWSISAITEFDKDDKDGFIGNVYSGYSCISLISCSAIMVCNIFLAKLLYAKDFFEAWQYVPPLLVGTLFNGIALIEGCIFTAVKDTKAVSITTVIGALVNTILNLALIPLIGAYGAAIATMIGYIVIWVIRTIKLKKIISLKVDWKKQLLCYTVIILQCAVALIFKEFYIQIPFLILIIIFQWSYVKKVAVVVIAKIKR